MKTKTDLDVDAIDEKIERLREDARGGEPQQQLALKDAYERREKLHALQLKRTLARLAKLPKAKP